MRRLVPTLSLAVAIGGLGLWTTLAADNYWWSAAVLHLEPLVVALLWVVAYALFVRRARAAAAGVLLGSFAFVGAVRMPVVPAAPPTDAAPWGVAVSRCAATLEPPERAISVLQWALPDDGASNAAVQAAVTLQVDVAVFYRLAEPTVLQRIVEERGGEWKHYPPEGTGVGVGVYTAGSFALCGEEDAWVTAMDTPGGYALGFVDLDDTLFPLVVTSFPSISAPDGWATRMARATERLVGVLDTLHSPQTVVVADAPIPLTYRHLESRLRGQGLRPAPSPLNWPAHVGRFPMLPVHAHDRVWAGVHWRTIDAQRLDASTGDRDPVVVTLAPSRRVGER